jgi:hypothetical protein
MVSRDEGRLFGRGAEGRERESQREMTVGDLVDLVTRRIATGLVIAAAVIGIAVYARPSPGHYDAVVAPDGKVVRINTQSGNMLVCDGGVCQSLSIPHHPDRVPTTRPEPPAIGPTAAPAPSLHAPASTPPAASAPATQTAPAAQPAR